MIEISNIQAIIDHYLRLLSNAEKLRSSEVTKDIFEQTEKLFFSMRKLFIASLMQNKQLICVSGLQGVGKTTLMKNFYGINADFMNVSIGRGERVPVLITEGDVNEPKIEAIRIEKDSNGEYSRRTNELKTEDVAIATKGEDSSIMYLEITVPYKHTYNKGVSFMLLPGFEKKNEYWNDLIEFSVNSSEAAIFVFNEASFSEKENDDYVKRVKETFGSNVVYVITDSDDSLDDNEQTKKTCMDVLKAEPDRVVCTGQYNDVAKNEKWIAEFKAAIDKYAMNKTQTQQNSKYIYDELLEIKDKLYEILGCLNDNNVIETKDFKNHSILKAFDKEVAKKRKELEKNISGQLENAKGESHIFIEKQIKNTPGLETMKRTLFGSSVKDFMVTRTIIKNSLNDGEVCLPDKYIGEAFLKTVSSLDNLESKESNALRLLIDTDDRDGHVFLCESESTKAAFQDIVALVQVHNKDAERYELQSESPERVSRAVAEVATYYYGLSSYDSLSGKKTSGLENYEPSVSNLTTQNVLQGAEESKKFALGLAGVMGVDALADGSVNLISQLASSFGIALPYAGAIAVLIVGAGGASTIAKDINRMQRTDCQSAKMCVNAIYDNIRHEALDRYDDFMNKVRDRIEENLSDLTRDTRMSIDIYNAKVNVNNLIDLLDKLTGDYRQQTYDVGTLLSR